MKPFGLLLVYVAFLIYATTLPFAFEPSMAAVAAKFEKVPFDPFVSAQGGRPSISDMTQNVLLFIPFGVLGMLTLSPSILRTSRRRSARQPRAMRAMGALIGVPVLAALTSACVETLQLFTIDRISSLNDVLTNAIGGFVGALTTLVLAGAFPRVSGIINVIPGAARRSFRTMMAAIFVVLVATWHPFDASLDVGAFASKVRTFVSDPWQVGMVSDEGVDLLRYAFLAGAAAVWLEGVGVRSPRATAAAATSFVAVVLEISQLIIGARMPGLKDMLVGAAGACAGSLIGPRIRTAPVRVSAVAVIAASWAGAGVMVLAPFTLAPERRPMEWVPFLTYYQYTTGQTVSHVVELLLAFLPIGFALACVTPGPRRWLSSAGVALPLAIILEYLQGWIVGRYPDVSDIMVMTLGAVVGSWLADYTQPRASVS